MLCLHQILETTRGEFVLKISTWMWNLKINLGATFWDKLTLQKSVFRQVNFWHVESHMCDLAGSVGSREHWLWDTAKKQESISFVFYCFENLSIALTLEPLVRFSWGFQQNVPLLMRISFKQKTENVTCLTYDWFPWSNHIYCKCVFALPMGHSRPNLWNGGGEEDVCVGRNTGNKLNTNDREMKKSVAFMWHHYIEVPTLKISMRLIIKCVICFF